MGWEYNLKFPCEIDNVKTLKKGMKITLAIEDENVKEVLKNIYNFMDRDMIVDFQINKELEERKMEIISHEQRKKIYAIFRDIADSLGTNKDYVKDNLKKKFCEENGVKIFSLSNCDRELAGRFIEFLIVFAFEYGVELNEHPRELIEDVKVYVEICYKKKICAVCGRGKNDNVGFEIHHCDGSTIGMGGNRNKHDDSEADVLPLCTIHHQEIHNIPESEFLEKYHLEVINKSEIS